MTMAKSETCRKEQQKLMFFVVSVLRAAIWKEPKTFMNCATSHTSPLKREDMRARGGITWELINFGATDFLKIIIIMFCFFMCLLMHETI